MSLLQGKMSIGMQARLFPSFLNVQYRVRDRIQSYVCALTMSESSHQPSDLCCSRL